MSRSQWGDMKEPTLYAGSVEEPGETRPWERERPEGESLGRWGSEKWVLPGFGEEGQRCGEWYPEAVCETCGELDLSTHICGRRSCAGPEGEDAPDCWDIWAQEAGVRATTRIQAFRYTQPDDWHRQAAHAIVSPPEGEVRNERQYWDGRSKAAEIAQEKGWRGFAVIPHPWRVTDEGKGRFREEVPRDSDGEPQYGVWKWLREDVDDWRDLTYWSPHYHIIGATGANMDPGEGTDGWVYKFIRSFEEFDGPSDSESHSDLYGAFKYLLSHTGFPEGSTKQVTTWYGDLANSVFVEDATEEWQHQKPSEDVMEKLEDEIEAVVGSVEEEGEDGAALADESDEEVVCPVEECDGELIDVFDVNAFLRQANPPPDVEKRMRVARDWRLGRVHPPPGMRKPQTKEQADEAFEAML